MQTSLRNPGKNFPHKWCIALALSLGLQFIAFASVNLVQNSSFEIGPDVGGFPRYWTSANTAKGVTLAPDARFARTGAFSLKLQVRPGARVNWYQVYQLARGVKPGETYTLSAYFRCEDVHGGAGAYCSINCFDAGDNRIGVFDSPLQLEGTHTTWQRLTTTAKLPAGTRSVKLICLLHGYGTVWVDDVQLEAGPTATAYAPSAFDKQLQAKRQAQLQAAQDFACAHPAKPQSKGRIAILHDRLEAKGAATDGDLLKRWLESAGYSVDFLTCRELANPYLLRGPHSRLDQAEKLPVPYEVVVLPYGAAFPALAADTFRGYLQQGGSCFTTGGYAFDVPEVEWQGKWLSPDDLPPSKAPVMPIFTFDSGLPPNQPGADKASAFPKLSLAPSAPGHGKCLAFAAEPMSLWATAAFDVTGKLPRNWAITHFRAKGDDRTKRLIIEWHEQDGSRWKAVVPLRTTWQDYTLSLSDFTYWHDSPTTDRGGPGDYLHTERVTTLLLGVSVESVPADTPQHFWLDDLGVQADDLAALRLPLPCLNTRTGRLLDALYPDPDQFPLFDPSHKLKWAVKGVASPAQDLVKGLEWKGDFTGFASVAMTSNQGHGFGPNLALWVPLVEGLDRYGRRRGALGALLYAYDGFFKGAAFAFFGVDNRDLFREENPGARQLFLAAIEALQRKVFLYAAQAEYSSYAPGEAIKFETEVADFGRRGGNFEVRFTCYTKQPGESASAAFTHPPVFSATRKIELKPWQTLPVEVTWTPQAPRKAGFYLLRVELFENGQRIDHYDNGVAIRRPVTGLPELALEPGANYFTVGGEPRFLLGSQIYWGQNGSVTARSPLAFEQNFRMMADNGLHLSRAFVPYENTFDERQSDAMVALAQRHGIVFYHSFSQHAVVAPGALSEENAKCLAVGKRYAQEPLLAFDICNEPTLYIDSPGVKEGFNAFLKQKYGTTARLRAAWSDPAVTLGAVEPKPLSTKWDDLRTRDLHYYLLSALQHWASTNYRSFKEGAPGRPTSVGFMHNWTNPTRVWDARLPSADLDFTDTHYYGDLSLYPLVLKGIDERALGKAMVVGECGARNHPSYEAQGSGENILDYNRRFMTLVHEAFGLGATALDTWHWRDPMEGLFPFGQLHADGVPRESLSVLRAAALTLGNLQPVYKQPEVMVVFPMEHFLGGARGEVRKAVHRAFALLMGCHVPFGVIDEGDLDKLPAGVKALLYPVPWCPSDAVVEHLEQFVRAGGALYFSGDITYTPERKPERLERLVDLAGVGFKQRRYPHFERSKAPLEQAKGLDGRLPAEFQADCALQVKLLRAQSLALAGDMPVVTLNHLGKGLVMYSADPVETAASPADWHRKLYLDFLARAGVQRNFLRPDRADLYCFHVHLQGGGLAIVSFNASAQSRQVEVKDARGVLYQFELAPHRPGLLVLDGEGRLLCAESQGPVLRGGKQVFASTGHVVVQSLDGRDLAQSEQLLILPQPGEPGVPPYAQAQAELTLPQLTRCRLELGDFRFGKWRALQPLNATPAGKLTYDAEQGQNLILAAPAGQFAAAKRAAEARLKLPSKG